MLDIMWNRAIISDILLWLIVLGLGTLATLSWLNSPSRRDHIIILHFKDANEISHGAMVRFMGTEVGYVKDILLKSDHVDVVIKTHQEALSIPSGSTFTVQFTGLVGSKSIEIVPPDVPRPSIQGKPYYLVEEPLRLKDTINYQIQMTQDLQEGAENIADFFGKKRPVEELQVNIDHSKEWTEHTLAYLDETAQDIHQLRQDVAQGESQTVNTLDDLIAGTRHAKAVTEPKALHQNVKNKLTATRQFTQIFTTGTKAAYRMTQAERSLEKFQNKTIQVGQWMEQTHDRLAPIAWPQKLESFQQKQTRWVDSLSHAERALNGDPLPKLQSARQQLQGFNQGIQRANAWIDSRPKPQPKSQVQTGPSLWQRFWRWLGF